MRNTTLHAVLEAFTADAALQLAAETSRGVEVPFELIEAAGGRRGRASLYCYRPLTGPFIRERLGRLAALPSYAPAIRALGGGEGAETYLRLRGEERLPHGGRERAEAVLRCFLARVFEERTGFELDSERFEGAYEELEQALYAGRCLTSVMAPLLGVALDPQTHELHLGDGLSLLRGEALPDAPPEAIWGSGEQAGVLIALTTRHERSDSPPLTAARVRFRRVLAALRLFERGSFALGPLAWTRTDGGAWRPVGLGTSGRPGLPAVISAAQEDEFRAFCNLITRRAAMSGELRWAMRRFEMGCERTSPFEALTDYLLALRALLEPEGPGSGRLAGRLAAICAAPHERAELAERIAYAISLERAVIGGLAPADSGADALVAEVAEHLRALLRDTLCGHLDRDLPRLSDGLIAEAAQAVEAA